MQIRKWLERKAVTFYSAGVLTEAAVAVEVQHVALAALALEHAVVQLEAQLLARALPPAPACGREREKVVRLDKSERVREGEKRLVAALCWRGEPLRAAARQARRTRARCCCLPCLA